MNDSAGKENNGVLLRKVGIFYEAIGISAKVLSEITGIPCTYMKSGETRFGLWKERDKKNIFSLLESERITYLVTDRDGLNKIYYGRKEKFENLVQKIEAEEKKDVNTLSTECKDAGNKNIIKAINSISSAAKKPSRVKKDYVYTKKRVEALKKRLKKEKRKTCVLTAVLTAVFTVFSIFIVGAIQRYELEREYRSVYKKGQTFYDEGKYEDAKICFESIPDEIGYRADIYLKRITQKETEDRCKETGFWMQSKRDGYSSIYSCVFCGAVFNAEEDTDFPYKYCPNCGKEMIEGDKSQKAL